MTHTDRLLCPVGSQLPPPYTTDIFALCSNLMTSYFTFDDVMLLLFNFFNYFIGEWFFPVDEDGDGGMNALSTEPPASVMVSRRPSLHPSLNPIAADTIGADEDGSGGGGGGGGGGVETIDEGGVATGNEAISAGESSSSSSASAGTSAGARVDDANDDGDGDGGAGDGDGGTTPTTSTSKPLPPGGAGEGKAPPPPVAAKKPKMGPPPVVARAASAAADGDGDAPAPAKPGEKIRSF